MYFHHLHFPIFSLHWLFTLLTLGWKLSIVVPTYLFYCFSYFRISLYAEHSLCSTFNQGKMSLFTFVLLYDLGPVRYREYFLKSSFSIINCNGLMKRPKNFLGIFPVTMNNDALSVRAILDFG